MNRKTLIFIASIALTVPAFALAAEVQNPLNPNFSSIPRFVAGVLQVMVQVGLPIVAFFLLYAGFKFVSAGGNSEKLNDAKENFKYVLIGALLILGAWVIATLIGNTVGQVIGTQISI
jgi:hypothetical protein